MPKPLLHTLVTLITLGFSILTISHVNARQSNCGSSGPAHYTVILCIEQPANNTNIQSVQAVIPKITVTNNQARIQRVVYYLNDEYLLTAFAAPYRFELPSSHFADGQYILSAEVLMRDGFRTEQASVTFNIHNAGTVPPIQNLEFTPYLGPNPDSEDPIVIAAAGDGTGGRTESNQVVDLILRKKADIFLYLGDVYEKGTYTEFYNWYGTPERFYGRLRHITNPIVGDHEYLTKGAEGYFTYWNNIPDYYSYKIRDWHVIAVNSVGVRRTRLDSEQYKWLEQRLNNSDSYCTLVYMHQPRFSVGPQEDTPWLDDMWRLLADKGVDVVVAGNDHHYQRWKPMNADGELEPQGVTQFIAGTAGHGIRPITHTDLRFAAGADKPSNAFGALFMTLNRDGMAYSFVNVKDEVLDAGTIPCSGAPIDREAPTSPLNLSAQIDALNRTVLSWKAAHDNIGVESYTIYRNGNQLTIVNGTKLTYTDITSQADVGYNYVIDAVDSIGNRSPLSNVIAVGTGAPEPTSTPTDNATVTPTALPTKTETATLIPSSTPTPTKSARSTASVTPTVQPTETTTDIPTSTSTPTSIPPTTPIATASATSVTEPTATSTVSPTRPAHTPTVQVTVELPTPTSSTDTPVPSTATPTVTPTQTVIPTHTVTPTAQPTATIISSSQCGGLVQEAEIGELYGNFMIGEDSNASDGRYIHLADGSGNRWNSPDPAHQAQYCVQIEDEGDYRIKGWVYAASGRDNSFFLKVDDKPIMGYLWDFPARTRYRETEVVERNHSLPLTVNLTAGMHTLAIFLREDGPRLDKVAFERVTETTGELEPPRQSAEIIYARGIAGRVIIDELQAQPNSVHPDLVGLKLFLLDADTEGILYTNDTETDINGNYYFDEVPLGEYILTLELPDGYLASSPATVNVLVDPEQMISVSFRLKETIQAERNGDTIYLPLVIQ